MEDIYQYLSISEAIATSGQPTEAQFAEICQAGFKVVINLAMPTSDNVLPNEGAVVEAQEMTYVPIPVLWEQPTAQDFQTFQAVLTENAESKVFVHCVANMRVSAFVYLHRRLTGVSQAEAELLLHQIWTPNENWQAFIQQMLA
ncbi:MAG: phosphatase [Leptolyngbya sp. SIO1D8]|nr:phosphatase [Leptolyngbya sp. SIO1D8]